MKTAVEQFVRKVKDFFYQTMLLGHACPKCNQSVQMIAESRCKCRVCGYEFDPTLVFQQCVHCEGVPILKVRRYVCRKCGAEIKSKFVFEGLIFDARYFSQKMVESRQRKKEQREKVRLMLAECRSDTATTGPIDLQSIPDLLNALNQLTQGEDISQKLNLKIPFDLHRYQEHILKHLDSDEINFLHIPPCSKEKRLDVIWRFVALIFLAHAGRIEIKQEGESIWVKQSETH